MPNMMKFYQIETDYDPENDCSPGGAPVTWAEKALFDEIVRLRERVSDLESKEVIREGEHLIEKIASYMRDEQFGLVHLEAILSVVVGTNLNAATEAEVLQFADLLQKDAARKAGDFAKGSK